MDQYFSTSLGKICQNVQDQPLRESLIQKINSFQLNPDEEEILIKIFPVVITDISSYMEFFGKRLEEMRGHTPNPHVWFSETEIKELNFSDPNFDWEKFSRILLRSIYLWGNDGFEYFVMRLLDKFESATDGTFLFENFPAPYDSVCTRASLILMFRYFATIKEEWVMHILRSDLLYLSVVMGLDLDKAVQEAVEYYDVVNSRLELCRKMATFMHLNRFPLGATPEGEEANLVYWINQFELYSEKKYDGISLVNFFNDQEKWKNTEEIDKLTIKSLIVVFTYLIDGHYILPPKSDTIVMKKNQAEMETKNEKIDFSELKTQLLAINDPSKIVSRLEDFSRRYQDPKILELYYYDEPTGKFTWKE